MVLFYCGHIGALSQIMSIRCHKHPDEEAVLAVTRIDIYRSNFIKKLVEEKVFNKVILMDIAFSLKEESVEKHEQKIIGCFDKNAKQNDIDFKSFSDIYIIQDATGELPIYLSIKNIPYTMVEMYMENMQQLDASRYHIAETNLKAHPSYTAVLRKHKALCGTADICKKRLRAENKTSDHSKSLPKDEWIDFNFLFANISDEYKNTIGKCLDENIASVQERDSCLVLPNSYGFLTNIAKVDLAHMQVVLQLALDYYNHNDESRIIVKEHIYLHPNFPLYKYIENPVVLDLIIPIEFYRFIPNLSINKILSISTSAAGKIGDCVKENVNLGGSYYTYFRLCHKLFFAFSLHLRLNNGKTVCNWAKGFNTEFIYNFAHFCFDDFPNYKPEMGFRWQDLKGDNFTIIDEVPPESKKDLIAGLNGADPLTKIVFLNTKKDFAFFDFERFDLLEYILPFVIKKTALNDKCISDTEDETLFFFCKDKAVREKARSFILQKSLKHTKLSLEISTVNIEDIYPSLYRREYISRIQEINRAFESMNKRTSDVAEQVAKLETSHKASYESLIQTVEQLSVEMHKNEMRTEERITQAVNEVKRLYQSLPMSNS
jgi:hypothetical protein